MSLVAPECRSLPCPAYVPAMPVVMRNASMKVAGDWQSRAGQSLDGETVRLRMVGNPGGPRVLVLGGISASRHVTSLDDGWWSGIAGPGRAIDTDRFLVIGMDYPPTGRFGAQDLCPEDFARLLHDALQEAGVRHLDAFIGASFGGMIGQAFARLYPEMVSALAVLCAGHRPHPMATALRYVQRQILELTEGTNREADGVALARKLAMTTYRTAEEFGTRFGGQGALLSYLDHHGTRFAETTSAARFRTLSQAIDNHSEDPRAIHVPTLVIGAEDDQLVPLSIVQGLAAGLPKLLGYEVLRSPFGHDAFLKETRAIAPLLRRVLP